MYTHNTLLHMYRSAGLTLGVVRLLCVHQCRRVSEIYIGAQFLGDA